MIPKIDAPAHVPEIADLPKDVEEDEENVRIIEAFYLEACRLCAAAEDLQVKKFSVTISKTTLTVQQ